MAPRTKLTSVRLYAETIDRVDAFCMLHPSFSRNYVMCLVLKRIFEFVEEDEIYKLLTVVRPDIVKINLQTVYKDLMENNKSEEVV